MTTTNPPEPPDWTPDWTPDEGDQPWSGSTSTVPAEDLAVAEPSATTQKRQRLLVGFAVVGTSLVVGLLGGVGGAAVFAGHQEGGPGPIRGDFSQSAPSGQLAPPAVPGQVPGQPPAPAPDDDSD
ncbi:MAG TPA: hypothetical protein VMT88_13315 [Actinomycetes bacterium]|nr:hypothetical protein [Actinomycetes bacterium]